MNKLELVPEQTGFDLTPATGVLIAPLDGGAPRSRKDIVGGWATVSVQWNATASGYEYLKDVYDYCEMNGGYHFLIDLPFQHSAVDECEAMFVPGSWKFTQQQGNMYTVTASLYVNPPVTAPPTWPSISDQQQGIITTDDGEPITT